MINNGFGAFESSQVPLSCREYTYNKQSKVRYHHGVDRVIHGKCSTSDGKLKMDCSGFLINTHSFESLLSLTYGQNLCVPCDLSASVFLPKGEHDCTCTVPISQTVIDALTDTWTAAGGDAEAVHQLLLLFNMNMTTMTWTTPWNMMEPPQIWNAFLTAYTADPSATVITLCGPSGSPFALDLSTNTLLPDGGNSDGSGVCIHDLNNIFGQNACSQIYYPPGTWTIDTNLLIKSIMFLEPEKLKDVDGVDIYAFWLAMGFKPEIPPMNQYNYLNGPNGMAYPGPIRFWRMQGQF